MEPVTHFLTGACISRAGLNRKSAYATLAAVLAAEAADLDMLWSLGGPVEALKHHRGWTHAFVGAPVVAGVVVGAVGLLHLWRTRRRARRGAGHATQDAKTPAIHWGWLSLTALIAALSHILLDWTNNYGVRPFFPFNPRWYAGSIVFIAEPVLWALLILALVMPWLLGLADREIGARRKPFRGQGWAIFALAGMVALWGWRWTEQQQALALLQSTQIVPQTVERIALEPYPINPYRWHAILETQNFYQTAEVNTLTGVIDSEPGRDTLYKPADTPAVEAAKQTFLGRVYLDWGRWAVVRDLGPVPVAGMDPPQLPPGRTWTTVQFRDLRFAYSYLGSSRSSPRATLGGWVYIVGGSEDAGEWMNGREQR